MSTLNSSSFAFETNAIHGGQERSQWTSHDVVPPISLTTTFEYASPEKHYGFDYIRSGNPTTQCLEKCLAALENARFALCYASGMSAVDNAFHMLKSGDHVVASDYLYGGVPCLINSLIVPHGIQIDYVDPTDVNNVAKALKPNTKMVWVESPSNPVMRITDIAAVAAVVKKLAPDAIVAVDNTFMSPYFQKPLMLGADLVMHSITKYINGHSDVLMGCLMTSREDLHDRLRFQQSAIGSVPSPFDSFLVIRGIKTLAVRMEKHHENGLKVARALERNPYVEKVLHPGLVSHPQYDIAKRQCTGYSGMCSFYIKGGLKNAKTFLTSLKVFTFAVSLGGVESLAAIPTFMTHHELPAETRMALGITDNLIRLSVGIENADDLIKDLEQALEIAGKA